MSAFGTSTPTTRPLGGLSKPWALPTPAFATWQGAGDAYGLTPAPQPQSVGSPPTSKGQAATRLLQALTGFLLRPLRIVLLHPRRWKGVKGDAVVHFTLDALNRPAQGNVDRFCTQPRECGFRKRFARSSNGAAASQVRQWGSIRSGFQSPSTGAARILAFGFWRAVVRLNVIFRFLNVPKKIPKKKVQFMSNFRMLTTKNTLNSAFFLMPTPTLTGGELTKSGVKPPSDYSKKIS